MITLVLNGVFFAYVLFDSVKQKEFRYTVAAALTLLYFIFVTLQSNYDLIENSQLFGWFQKIILVILAGYLLFTWVKSGDIKAELPPVIFACAACVSRFLRTLVFNLYTGNMQAPGADVQAIYQEFYVYYVIVDSVTKLALLLMLFSITWYLGKSKVINH